MARKLKYQLDFCSLANKACQVQIYVEGYIGTAVTQLTGTDNPFEYEEDNDTDLLHFVRFRTGYLRVVEQNFGDLNDLQPASLTSHYVVAKYDGAIVFTGYIQCQEFSNAWEAAPRVLEIPVISPLGLLESFNFSTPATAPTLTTIGLLVKEIMETLNPYVSGDDTMPGWQGVIYPGAVDEGDATAVYYPFNAAIHSTAVCPFNESFEPLDTVDDLYDPVDFLSFVEGFLISNGWMIHDDPTNIIFTEYDNITQKNYRLTLDGLENFNSYSEWNTDARTTIYLAGTPGYYEYADNNAELNAVPPLKSLTIKVQDEVEEAKLPTNFMRLSPNANWTEGVAGTNYFKAQVMNAVGAIVTSDYMKQYSDGSRIYVSNGHIQCDTAGIYPLSMNIVKTDATRISLSQGWYIVYNHQWNGIPCFTYTVFENIPYTSNLILKIAFDICNRGGENFDTLKGSGWSMDVKVVILLKCGNLYYNPSLSHRWNTNPSSFTVTFDKDTGKMIPNKSLDDVEDIDGYVLSAPPSWITDPIEISIGFNAESSDAILPGDVIRITNISLGDAQKNSEKYRQQYLTEKVLKGTNKGTGEASLDLTYNDWFTITHNYRTYSLIKSKKSYGKGTGGQTFLYMFKTQTFLTAKFKQKADATLPSSWNPLLPRFNYEMGSGYKWRIISDSFNLSEDEHQFVLAHTDGL